MKNIKNKNRLFSVLNSLDEEYKKLSIRDFLMLIENQIKKEEEEEKKEEEFVIKTYKSTFLKLKDKDSTWGESVKVFKVENIFTKGFDVDYNKIYQITGEEISFSKINVFKRKLKKETNDVIVSFSSLKEFELITEQEYLDFLKKYKELDNSIKKIFK
jgi:hypothetical protein